MEARTIPVSRVADIRAKVEKLNRKAAKLGLEQRIEFLVLTDTARVEARDVVVNVIHGEEVTEKRLFEVVDVEFGGESPRINGWELVAIVEPFDDTAFFTAVPGAIEVPKNVRDLYTSRPTYCNHCEVNRVRSATFVLARPSEGMTEYNQVGRQCLKDFLGHPAPESMIHWGNLLNDLAAEFDTMYNGMGSGAWLYKLEEVLTFAAYCIREYGWVKSADGTIMQPSTRNSVEDILAKSRKPTYEDIYLNHQEDIQLAETALKYAQETLCENAESGRSAREDISDYEYNIKVMCCRETPVCDAKRLGVAVSIIRWYQNQMEQRVKREERVPSKFLGQPGDKLKNVPADILRVHYTEGYYGTTTIITFVIGGSNYATWFASGYHQWEAGDKVNIKSATIKGLEVYRDNEQTVLTRCKLTAA